MTTVLLKVLLPEELKQDFKATCKEKGYTMSERVKEFIREDVKK